MSRAEELSYVGLVAMWMFGAGGYRVEEQFVKGEQIVTGAPLPEFPEYVIRIDLDGPYADLTWDTMAWSVQVYQDADADPDPDLSQHLTDQSDATPGELLRLVRPVLDEAVRRWGNPQWTITDEGRAALLADRTVRSVEDVPPATMSFAEIKAIARST